MRPDNRELEEYDSGFNVDITEPAADILIMQRAAASRTPERRF